jgi:predicted XRE-type DNA-binding protein
MKAKTKAKAESPVVDVTAVASVEMGTGNVFADLGLSDPDDRRLRVQLATRLLDLLKLEGLTQAAVAKRLSISQPHVSELKHFKLSRFSSERLLYFITLMDRDVEIFIRPRASSALPPSNGAMAGAVTVWAAA